MDEAPAAAHELFQMGSSRPGYMAATLTGLAKVDRKKDGLSQTMNTLLETAVR